jgi:type IV secretion system protein VirB4
MIITVTLLVAGLGVLLLIILVNRILAVDAELKLKKHRAKDAALADLLNYAAVVDDGVILGKNGSFLAAWIYRGDDNASSTDEQRETVSTRINQALARLGSGWMAHMDCVRRPAPNYSERGKSYFPDAVTAAIDEERRRLFQHLGTMYESYFVLTITWFPPMLAQRKFAELMFDDDTQTPDHKARTMGLIEHFKREVENLESRLSLALKLTRLRGHTLATEDGREIVMDDFLSWLQYCITGEHHPIKLPDNPMYLDAVIGGQEMWGGVIPRIGRKFVQTVAIEGFPLESTPGMLSALAELPSSYRWSNRFIFLDQHESVNHLDKFRKEWKQKVRGLFDQVFNTGHGHVDQDALTMMQDAESAIAEVNSGLIAVGYYTAVVVLLDENREQLEASARQIEKAIARLGFAARVETINNLDAFLGSLPGHGVENVRRPLLNTLNLADLLPTSTIWTGSAAAPSPKYKPGAPALMHCVTSGRTPFRLNLHVSDVGHTLIFGPTGAGKSTLLAILAAQFRRYEGIQIFAFDKGQSLYALSAAIRAGTHGKSGLHFIIAGDDSQLAFCPLQFLETKTDRAWAMEWIDTILALNGLNTNPAQRNMIAMAIVSMHETRTHTLSEFCTTVQDDSIRQTLKQYTVDGMMGYLLDAEQDGLALSDFTVFEIEELMNLGEKYALPTLLYLFRRIERSLHGQPAVIILDEAWIMLGHPVFREKIREWLKVLRKANCIVILATQSLSDASKSGILDVLVESTASKIYLPNIYARDEEASALYRRMGLNAKQIEILAGAIMKRDYYLVSSEGRRLFDLALGPLALAFVGASDKEEIAVIKNLEKKHGHDWVQPYLAARRLRLEDYLNLEAA